MIYGIKPEIFSWKMSENILHIKGFVEKLSEDPKELLIDARVFSLGEKLFQNNSNDVSF